MRCVTCLFVLTLSLLFTSQMAAQDSAQRIEKLRQDLTEVQAKETELRARLEQLNNDLKPENIERSLAGIGSTHPEDLREHRRRLLTIEKDGVLTQLKTLEEQRVSLETAIAAAENAAYLQSAQASPARSTQMFVSGNGERTRRLWIALAVGMVTLFIISAGAFLIVRKRSA